MIILFHVSVLIQMYLEFLSNDSSIYFINYFISYYDFEI